MGSSKTYLRIKLLAQNTDYRSELTAVLRSPHVDARYRLNEFNITRQFKKCQVVGNLDEQLQLSTNQTLSAELNSKLSKNLMKHKRKVYSISPAHHWHNFLNRHNSNVLHGHPQDDSGCRFCSEDEESTFHIMACCLRFVRQRCEHFGIEPLSHPLSRSKPRH